MATDIHVQDALHALGDEELQEELLDLELDADSEPAHIREARRLAFMREMEQLRACKEHNCGSLQEIFDDKAFLNATTTIPQVVCHFFHKDFKRCAIMDKHLAALAPKHFKTKFVKISAESAPFIVQRLKVQVLPTVICFVDGVVVDRIVGFEELGGSDSFKTVALEKRLAKAGVVQKSAVMEESAGSVCGYAAKEETDSDAD